MSADVKGFALRYFILAFTCLLLPAVIILPEYGANPDFIEHAGAGD